MGQIFNTECLIVDQNQKSIEVEIQASFYYDRGVYLESNHPSNGHDKGWRCDNLSIKDKSGNFVDLSETQFYDLMQDVFEKFHESLKE